MRKREFINAVEALSKDYTVCQESFDVLPGILDNGAYAQLIVYYKRKQVVMLNDDWQFSFSNNRPSQEFERLPFSHKLWMLCAEYAMTPVNKRKDEPKFRVRMMPNLPDQDSSLYYVNYSLKNSEINVGPDVDMSEDPLFRSKCHFTKKEYVSIQREFPEWLPKFDKNDPHFEIVEGEDDE